MPFPTNDGSNAESAADQLASIGRLVRGEMVKYVAQCDANSVNAHDLVAMAANLLRPARTSWATLSAVSGVQVAVRSKFVAAGFANDAAVTAAMTEVLNAMDAVLLYVVTNTPKDGSGYLLTLQVVGNAFVQRTITAAGQITPLRAQLVTLQNALTP